MKGAEEPFQIPRVGLFNSTRVIIKGKMRIKRVFILHLFFWFWVTVHVTWVFFFRLSKQNRNETEKTTQK